MNVSFRPQATGEREAAIGVVAEDSRIVWLVTFAGEGRPVPPPGDGAVRPAPAPVPVQWPRRASPMPPRAALPTPAVRPGVPTLTRATLASLRRSGLRFTQAFGTAGRVTWTLEHRGTVLARARRTVAVGRTSVTLKLTAAGKRVLRTRKPATLTLRTKGTLERVTKVKLRGRRAGSAS
jgi:hypothetical protein